MAALFGLLGVRLPSRPQCALPAVATSALLVTTAFGWLEMFTLAGVAGWLFAGTLLGLPGLDRTAVRIGYRFCPPAPAGRDWMLLYSGRLTQDQAVAVGVHEAGHHMSGRGRSGLAIGWLSWPWRVSCQLLMRQCARMPFAEAVKMLMPVVFIVVGVMLVREHAPPEQVMPALVLLAVVALGGFVAPFAALLGMRELPAVQL